MDEMLVQEYKKLLREETNKGFWDHFEGRKKFTEPIFLATLSVLLTIIGLFVVNEE